MPLRQADRSPPAKASAPSTAARTEAGRFAKPGAPKPVKKLGKTRSDLTMAALGLTLGLICALFPWYIFFNQEQFGPRAMKFSGSEVELAGDAAMATPLLPRGDGEVRIIGIPDLSIDYAPTGSLPRRFSAPTAPAAEQPFPDDATPFRILHVTAGRAMIEDDAGIWVVQRGSTLPDKSHVEKIEEQNGRWVVVTNAGKVLDID